MRMASRPKMHGRLTTYRKGCRCERCCGEKSEYQARTNLRRKATKYGVTVDEINELLEPGVCYACGSGHRLHIDHDHNTGEVRGVLCSNCNTGLGLLGDEVARLKDMIAYLKGDFRGLEK